MIIIGGRVHSLEEILTVGQLGYPFMEISLNDPDVVSSWVPRLIKMQEATPCRFLAHYPNEDHPLNPDILRERFLPRIKKLMDLSRRLNITKATVHFWMDRRWLPAEILPSKLEILSRMVEYGESRGITVCLENLSERADSFAPAFDAIANLKMTLDIGHAQLLSKQNTSWGFLEKFFSRIAHVHAHDNRGGKTVKDDLHLALGEGIVDYRAIITSLCAKGYDGTITMEVKPQDMPRTKQLLEECIHQAAGCPRMPSQRR
jgi:sugar phosphate isomerase/epimerase